MSDYDIGNVFFLSHGTFSTMSNVIYAQVSSLWIVKLRCLLLNVKQLEKSLEDI